MPFAPARRLKMLALSTLFVAGNWYVFIYSVMSNQMLQGSLGYFILPIVNVALKRFSSTNACAGRNGSL